MKILLMGKNGQLGFELRRALSLLGEVTEIGRKDCDVRDDSALRRLVKVQCPDVIVNATAYTAVDQAESNSQSAIAVNTKAPQVLAEESEKLGSLLIHYSSDYVFDGEKLGAYQETDQPNPISIYGLTKLNGDLAIQNECKRHIILRTSWVYGVHGNNFLKKILDLASERIELKIVADQFGAPTSVSLLSDLTAHIIRSESNSPKDFPYGIYNAVASGTTSWHQYACYVIERARQKGRKMSLLYESIKPITAAESSMLARRPANSRLDTSKIRNTFSLKIPNWEVGVDYVLDQILGDSDANAT